MSNTSKTNPVAQSNERKWRNKSTGTVYASVEHNGTVIATVTTDAGSTYSVRWDKLEEVTSPTQSDKTIELEEIVRRVWLDGAALSPGLTRNEAIAALTARENRIADERDSKWKAAVEKTREIYLVKGSIDPTGDYTANCYDSLRRQILKDMKLNPQEPHR